MYSSMPSLDYNHIKLLEFTCSPYVCRYHCITMSSLAIQLQPMFTVHVHHCHIMQPRAKGTYSSELEASSARECFSDVFRFLTCNIRQLVCVQEPRSNKLCLLCRCTMCAAPFAFCHPESCYLNLMKSAYASSCAFCACFCVCSS